MDPDEREREKERERGRRYDVRWMPGRYFDDRREIVKKYRA